MLANFAADAAGKLIPRELVAKLNSARYFGQGISTLRNVGDAQVSLQLHKGPARRDLGAAVRGIYRPYGPSPVPDWLQRQASFGHLSPYSAAYYTYLWSQVIANDMFILFKAQGTRDCSTPARYRDLVLAPGGTRPAADLVADFLGRPISLEAFKENLEKD